MITPPEAPEMTNMLPACAEMACEILGDQNCN
jgi:hypothetical protein